MTAALLLIWIAPSASALTVIATTLATPPSCLDEVEGGPAFCRSVDPNGSAVAAADESFNGGVEIDVFGDSINDYTALMGFRSVYRNESALAHPVSILSILLPGQVQVFGEANVELRVAITFTPADPSEALKLLHLSVVRSDANGNATWSTVDVAGPPPLPGAPRVENAGKPTNWPADGPVPTDITLPFSVLRFDFGSVDPGEEFELLYELSVFGEARGFIEFVHASVGDPLQFANMSIIELDDVFVEVPEPEMGMLLALGLVGLAARRRLR